MRNLKEMTNLPMIFGLTAMSMIRTMIGTETTPFTTALQYSALIGSMGVNPIANPAIVDITMIP
jgi:hypothetical protein